MFPKQNHKSILPAFPPTDRLLGLSSDEARQRLTQCGPNTIPEKSLSLWQQLALKFWAPVPWMLEVVIGLQMVLGRYFEGMVAKLVSFRPERLPSIWYTSHISLTLCLHETVIRI